MMAYENRGYSRSNNSSNNSSRSSGSGEKSKAVFSQLVKQSKTGKLTFSVMSKAITIPANTRVTLVELSEKRKAALEASSKQRGFSGAVPTHELIGFPIEQK